MARFPQTQHFQQENALVAVKELLWRAQDGLFSVLYIFKK